MKTMRTLLAHRTREEKGAAEIISILFTVAIMTWLIFSLIDISLYMQARSAVQNVARDAARSVAIYGGDKSNLNPSGKKISEQTQAMLYSGGKCTISKCPNGYKPKVSCTPTVTKSAGEVVSCTVTYKHQAIYGNNPITGFVSMVGGEFKIRETARSETGFR